MCVFIIWMRRGGRCKQQPRTPELNGEKHKKLPLVSSSTSAFWVHLSGKMHSPARKLETLIFQQYHSFYWILIKAIKFCCPHVHHFLQIYPVTTITIQPLTVCGTAHPNTRTLCAQYMLSGNSKTNCTDLLFECTLPAC